MIGERLLSERERLCLSQGDLAAKTGITARSQRNYEKGERMPDAAYIAALANIGFDILFVVTGQRSLAQQEALSPREAALLNNYRHCSEDGQDAIERVALVAAKPNQEQLTGKERPKNSA